jgi:EAL domain-containing protein (putative c-di-GMP-specific phosphodiesterase class I)
MATKDLLEALPDLILLLQQDGTVLGSYGGRGVPELKPATDPVGRQLEVTWAAPITKLIRQLTREAIAFRSVTGALYEGVERRYDIRVTAHGSYCAVCAIRGVLDPPRQALRERRENVRKQLGSAKACFSHEHPRLRTAARPDLAHELKEAIAKSQIGLRYVSRHDLATGRLTARVGYLRWRHPQYGEIDPLKLVRLAEITNQAGDLTRAALQRLQTDFAAFAPQWSKGVRISFGAPKHHILYEDFIGDIERFLAESALPAERLELRIPVKACFARAASDFNSIAERGVQFVVDDLGEGMDWPLNWLGRAPMHGLQLSRGWVKAMQSDPNTLNLCRAGLAIAKTYALTPIAAGVDEPTQRDILLALGCLQGSGDLYRDELIPPDRCIGSRATVAPSPPERTTPFTAAAFLSG